MLGAVAARYPFLDAGGPIAFAHRGASAEPSNSQGLWIKIL